MTYDNKNYTDLLLHDVKCKDVIIFSTSERDFQYSVEEVFLNPIGFKPEAAILQYLIKEGFITEDMNDYCAHFYGYPPYNPVGDINRWPDYRRNDYKSISKLIFNVFELLTDGIKCKQLLLMDITEI